MDDTVDSIIQNLKELTEGYDELKDQEPNPIPPELYYLNPSAQTDQVDETKGPAEKH